MSEQLNRIEDMLTQLITIVEGTNSKLGETNSKVIGIERELSDFRSETSVHFKKLDHRVKLIESALDETMVRIQNNLPPRN
jgi:predicted  nucleic acid-binding Zn-ribbon protein